MRAAQPHSNVVKLSCTSSRFLKARPGCARYPGSMSDPKRTSDEDAQRPHFDAERRSLLGLAALAVVWPCTVGAAASKVKGKKNVSTATIFEVVSHYADTWRSGDVPAIMDCYHADFTLHYPGDHALAGTHPGKQASLRVLAEVSRRTNRSLVEIVSVMAGDERGAIVARERWRSETEEAIVERVLVYAVQDGKLRDCWLFDADQKTVARFLG